MKTLNFLSFHRYLPDTILKLVAMHNASAANSVDSESEKVLPNI